MGAAKSSLAATTAELVDVLPALATCSESGIAMHQRDHLGQPQVLKESFRSSSGRHARSVATMSNVPDEVGEQSGLDVHSFSAVRHGSAGSGTHERAGAFMIIGGMSSPEELC